MADGVVKFAVDKLEALAQQEIKLQSEVGKKVRQLKDELEWLRTFLQDGDRRRRQEANEYIDLWVRQTREVAFDAEDLLDEYFHKGRLHCHSCLDVPSLVRWIKGGAVGLFVRHSIHDNIGSIRDRLKDIREKREHYNLANLASTWAPSRKHYSDWSALNERDIEKELVGIRQYYKTILKRLKNNDTRRAVIAITGKSGIGKTALANKIYGRSFVRNRFDCIIWVHVPQNFKLMDILNNIIQQASGATQQNMARRTTEEEMKRELSDQLHNKRYLIVLDDVRSWEEWKFLLAALPDNGDEGNRVLVTTQLTPPTMPNSADLVYEEEETRTLYYCHYTVSLKRLDKDQGKELFCRRVFGQKDFPEDFEKPFKLEELLQGLPLAIVLLAGLLRSRKQDEWENVINQLHSSSHKPAPTRDVKQQQESEQAQPLQQQEERQQRTGSSQYRQLSLTDKILTLSFDDLPPQLKPCFLYFSAFKAEAAINSGKLVRLWIAEGFVQPMDGWTMEECGQDYLKKLVSRCLVNLVETDYNYTIVTVSICDHVLEFARSEAGETNFLQVHNSTTGLSHAAIRRLSLHNTFDPHIGLALAAPKLRSLLCNFPEAANDDVDKSCTENLRRKARELIKGRVDSFTIYRSKFLRVVDLKGVQHRCTLPKEIGWLIHLRYLGLAHTSLSSLPKSIKKLRNLQTLDITDTKIDAVPREFWKIQALRHVLAQHLKTGPDEVHALADLQSLHGVSWGRWAQNGAAVKRMTNLRSVQLRRLSTTMDGEALMVALTSLECLTSLDLEGAHLPLNKLLTKLGLRRLQYLRLHGPVVEQGAEQSHGYYLLPNLTKLELYASKISQVHINMIEKLPDLIELVLGEDSYNGDALTIHDGGLPVLRKLQLRNLQNLREWQIEESALLQLEDLSIVNCNIMTTLGNNRERLTTLKMFKKQLPSLKQLTVHGRPTEDEQQDRFGEMEVFCKELPSRKRRIA